MRTYPPLSGDDRLDRHLDPNRDVYHIVPHCANGVCEQGHMLEDFSCWCEPQADPLFETIIVHRRTQ